MSLPLFSQHERTFDENQFVYPVLSRRAGGISVGVNLNPDKVCNFNCIYCQVNRVSQATTRFVDTDRLLHELKVTLEIVESGRLYQTEKFAGVPARLRRLNDIAFSGDGEPTTYKNFDSIIEACADIRRTVGSAAKMVLITNASMLHREQVQRGLEILDQNQGEIWAKLEAGTEGYFQKIGRAAIPLSRVVENITLAARQRPLVIQSLFVRIDGQQPPPSEIESFCQRLCDIQADGGKLRLVQIYTVARPPHERCVSALSSDEVDSLVDLVQRRTGIPTLGFHGTNAS